MVACNLLQALFLFCETFPNRSFLGAYPGYIFIVGDIQTPIIYQHELNFSTVVWLLCGAFLFPKIVALPHFYFHDGRTSLCSHIHTGKIRKATQISKYFYIRYTLFTECSRFCIYFWKGNERGVDVPWKGQTSCSSTIPLTTFIFHILFIHSNDIHLMIFI